MSLLFSYHHTPLKFEYVILFIVGVCLLLSLIVNTSAEPTQLYEYDFEKLNIVTAASFTPSPNPTPSMTDFSKIGPTGKHWPSHTPVMSTPATHSASSLAEVQTIINNLPATLPSSGIVIELTKSLPDTDFVINYPNKKKNKPLTADQDPTKGWVRNVLIRPPIGKRLTVQRFKIQCPRVTIAGFDVIDSLQVVVDKKETWEGKRSGYARMWALLPKTYFGLLMADESFFVECVSVFTLYNGTADRVNVKGCYNCDKGIKGAYIDGSWFGRSYRPVGGPEHLDTLQCAVGGKEGIFDFTLSDSVLLGASNAAFISGGITGNLTFSNSYIENAPGGGKIPQGASAVNSANAEENGGQTQVLHTTINGADKFSSLPKGPTVVEYSTFARKGFSNTGIGNNFANSKINPPNLPDLFKVWPECPVPYEYFLNQYGIPGFNTPWATMANKFIPDLSKYVASTN
ncbi:unnamed protein product [Didymodactylos carnosus]|uniref:Uncharacterized protein n=1 Tax=Didymodactylos carnosus TaxID=1234261 RepID=A0A814G0A2_9BILA|nr:unnamed protein product [Didymodactylos carnosus]CAF0990040.1 unnamed protein product [Didymodactylos carnosus]CAF3694860.1 unnamed protein product [Didymodactylos carnosus]CAF3762098.1 unnamed protein product [Didymodactylos carnosus]